MLGRGAVARSASEIESRMRQKGFGLGFARPDHRIPHQAFAERERARRSSSSAGASSRSLDAWPRSAHAMDGPRRAAGAFRNISRTSRRESRGRSRILRPRWSELEHRRRSSADWGSLSPSHATARLVIAGTNRRAAGGDNSQRAFGPRQQLTMFVAAIVLLSAPSRRGIDPSGSHASTPATKARIVPKRSTCVPPALVAISPPMVQLPLRQASAGTASRLRRRGREGWRGSSPLGDGHPSPALIVRNRSMRRIDRIQRLSSAGGVAHRPSKCCRLAGPRAR